MLLRLRSPLLALVLLLVTPVVASAQEASSAYDRALAAYLEADFDVSRARAEEARDDGSTSLGDAARAHLLLALLAHVERADRTVVAAQIEDAVALDATVQAPEGSPRAFVDRVDEARAAARGSPRTLVIEREPSGAVRATLTGVPPRLVDRITLVCGGASATASGGSSEVALPRGAGSCEATAHDARGRVLVTATQGAEGTPLGAPSPPGASDDTPFIVLGVVGALLVVGGAIAITVVLVSPSGDATLGAPRIPEWSR